MAQSDIETFLNDLLLRYDPSIDLTNGSRAQVDLIQPILGRIGPDPFDNDITTFVEERIRQTFPTLNISQTNALRDTLINPMRVLLEPIVREIKLVKLRQSVANIERLSDDEVDALMSNFFEARKAGGYARGTVRVYFTAPVTVSFTLLQVASTRSGLRYIPSPAQTITKDQMIFNREGQEYYCDISYVAEKRGDEYNVDRNDVIAVANLASATRVRNPNRFVSGQPREDSIAFVSRVETKLSDRTLTVSRGIISELTDNFSSVRRIQVIGFKDPEMQRDVIKGGSLGGILPNDTFGSAYGTATAIDDGNGDITTRRLSAPSGNFVSRIGSAGTSPDGYYLSLMYLNPNPVFIDAEVTAVISNTDVLVDYQLPYFPLTVYWSLRRKELTISNIPGGITLPDTLEGDIVLRPDEVHIGGKTDIYIAGEVSSETAAITGISDELPIGSGGAGQTTSASDVIIINDPPVSAAAFAASLADGFYSVVLSEGVDAGSYDIRSITVVGLTVQFRVPVNMTGTAGNLLWRVVDQLDVELTEPKDIKVTGADLSVVAGNPGVTTLSSTNFIDANVQANDILRIDADAVGGDYTVLAVGPVTLTVDPAPPRTAANLRYTVFRPTGAVNTPVIRVTKLELLDSGGAPNGVTIPYREPVAILTRGFQNEGSGLEFEGYPLSVGLMTGPLGASVNFGAGATLDFEFRDPQKLYAGTTATYTLTLTGVQTSTAIAASINANPTLAARNVRATEHPYNGSNYVGIYCPEFCRILPTGTANVLLDFPTAGRGATNADVSFGSQGTQYNPRLGDLIEFLGGNNTGALRVLAPKDNGDAVMVGLGPTDELISTAPLHEVSVLLPENNIRVRGGRPSIGSARVYFLSPTSAEFRYGSTSFSVQSGTDTFLYRPDPENDRILQPAPPLTDLPRDGVAAFGASGTQFSDATVDFQALNIRPGDLLDVLYQPITSTGAIGLPNPAVPIAAIVGQTLILRLDEGPWITINFPIPLLRDDLADYINEQVGQEIASIDGGGLLVLEAASSLITIRDDSTILGGTDPLLLFGAARTTASIYVGTYIISAVAQNLLTLSSDTPLPGAVATTNTAYRVRRYLQRISSTEMNQNTDATGLYYVDVEMLSLAPGDLYNVPTGLVMTASGVVADGYRLYAENNALTYSRAERLWAQISRTILLPGSSDSPSEYVQISRQNVQVSYDRSQLVDDIQSFTDSDLHRVVNEEILVRHLSPHYVNIGWRYVGGELEISMRAAISTAIEELEAYDELEVLDLTRVMASRGATSIYSLSAESPTGRTAPVMVVVYHDTDRNVRAAVVTDFVRTSRTQRFIADNLAIARVAPTFIR